jgi:hypothetical protein
VNRLYDTLRLSLRVMLRFPVLCICVQAKLGKSNAICNTGLLYNERSPVSMQHRGWGLGRDAAIVSAHYSTDLRDEPSGQMLLEELS